MATIGNTYPQLIDMYKASQEGMVIELLKQNNPILDDAIATPCNMDALHRHSIRTGYPSVSWGKLYKGVKASKATMQQVDDTTGFLQARSEIDVNLLKLAPDPAKARLVDSAPYLEVMNQEMATGIFYHNTDATPEKFKGLAARFNLYNTNIPDPTKPNIANQVIHGGGSGSDNTSIWFVTWADHATSLLYPKQSKAGVSIMDKGEEKVADANGDQVLRQGDDVRMAHRRVREGLSLQRPRREHRRFRHARRHRRSVGSAPQGLLSHVPGVRHRRSRRQIGDLHEPSGS
jgi:hypothetical protein